MLSGDADLGVERIFENWAFDQVVDQLDTLAESIRDPQLVSALVRHSEEIPFLDILASHPFTGYDR